MPRLRWEAPDKEVDPEVLAENQSLGGPDGPHMGYYRAATLARLGRTKEARQELERVRSMPFGIPPERFVSAFRDPAEAYELLSSLESVGMTIASGVEGR